MHRFRKKSDASTKRNQITVGVGLGYDLPDIKPLRSPVVRQPLPELPPASNFRTSLILPDLTRRFTLLRTSSGQPLSIEQLRTRFAEQRARGAENSISEEEEDMLLETLGRIRENGHENEGAASGLEEEVKDGEESLTSREGPVESDYNASYERSSVRSTNTVGSYVPSASVRSSPSSRSAKRYSNNLFGSGRDYNYIRSQTTRAGSQRSALSITPTESSMSLKGNSVYSDRPVTPEGNSSISSSSVQSSPIADPNDKTPVARPTPLGPATPVEHTSYAVEYRLAKKLNPAALKRASLALEEALKEIEEEIEEEADDEIVMPRSAPATKTQYAEESRFSGDSIESVPGVNPQKATKFEAGMALSPDKHNLDAEVQRVSPVPSFRSRMSPSPRLPGYIPGMPRPMTPREQTFEVDEQIRSLSTTPRPTSPLLPNINGSSSPLIPASIAAGLMRREPNMSAAYSPRSVNGSFSFEEQQRASPDSSTDDSLSSSIYERRRPASPLAGPAYQPMTVPSRPSTPSNIIWNTSSTSIVSPAPKTHSRNPSGSSIASDTSAERSAPTAGRPLRSPALPDSPLVDRGHPARGVEQSALDSRSLPTMANPDLGSPVVLSNRSMHSPTPTQSRSPARTSKPLSPTDDLFAGSGNKRGSRQQGRFSPFDFGHTHPLVFSPMAKSSRSSIASEGSSYHSDDDTNKPGCDFDFFSEMDAPHSWHNVSGSENTSSPIHEDSQDDSEAEDILSRYAGLTKLDFVAIQEKLVSAAVAKASTPDPRERAPSLRRRRPSTSQSNYSLNGKENRVASPPPQIQTPSRDALSVSRKAEKSAAASTSPDSVGSLQSSPSPPVNGHQPEQMTTSPPRQQRDLSPTTRRNRDLAQALFGEQSQDMVSPATASTTPTSPEKPPPTAYQQYPPPTPTLLERSSSQIRSPVEEPASATSSSSPPYSALISRNPSILRSPQSFANQTELALEVQRKTEAATASLKRGPSMKYQDNNGSSISIARKRIAPHQISAPHLVSASTSLDTIPLRSPSVSSTNPAKTGKLGQRLRKWGTLRGKPTMPSGEEVTPFPLDAQSAHLAPVSSPSFSQTIQRATPNIIIPVAPASASLAEPERPKVPLPSPPATAGPGIKGFMSRFRKPVRPADALPEGDRRSVEQQRPPQLSPEFSFPRPAQSSSTTPYKTAVKTPTSPTSPPPVTAPPANWNDAHQQPNANHSLALKQLFDAASTIGLDQTALNDLLKRSGSTSSNLTMLTRNDLSFTNSTLVSYNDGTVNRARSPTTYEGRSNTAASLDHRDDTIVPINVVPRNRGKAEDNNTSANAIVRRTIIFPSESKTSMMDLNILTRKNSAARRRRSASAASVTSSSRSVHDRAPTPPPPRAPNGRRFSHDASPPVPQLPTSLSAQAESLLMPLAIPRPAPANAIEKSNSAYESLYEMYSGERAGSAGFSDGETSPHDRATPEHVRGVEVIELANGETIWSIVNGLRDEDAESMYASRTSFASDYSVAPQQTAEGVQVLFKEHARTGSKGSSSSFLSRKKTSAGKNRPETKVFYSSSNQIGRLIENLSEGREAGSFNFLPTKRPGHSTSSSFQSDADIHWTVEERLEHMLGSMTSS